MKRSTKLSSNSILRTAYVLGGLIVLAALCLVLISVIKGIREDKNADRRPNGPDYAVSQLSVWEGEALPEAEAFLNDSYRPLVNEARYLLMPNQEIGDQDIAILMQLGDGTTRTENAVLTIRETVIRWEIGTEATPESLLGKAYKDAEFSEPLSNFTEIGEYPISVLIGDKELPFTLIAQDTVPPVVTLRENLKFYVNQKLTAEDFVESCEDESEVEYHLSEEPSTLEKGDKLLQLIATDAAGNSRTYEVVYSVSGDGEPPVISGVGKMKTIRGVPVSYLRGVTAVDGNDGTVKVTVAEPEGFSLRQAGTYTITYTSTDKAGNTASETAELEIIESLDSIEELSEEDIYRMGDYIVESLKDGTVEKDDRKFLRALYLYVQNHMYYADNKVVQDWQYGAATAIARGYGDCHNYYAFARLLLTCAGFENLMVEHPRPNEWSNAHYWNLVKVGGAWYHFDTTPRVNRSDFFLLTDAQMDAYSAYNGNCFERDKNLYPATPD